MVGCYMDFMVIVWSCLVCWLYLLGLIVVAFGFVVCYEFELIDCFGCI